jgi:hypothetical protein
MIFYEDTSYEVGALVEEAAGGKPKKLYLKGVFAESENKNKNGRIYDRAEMLREVDRINTAAAQGHYVLGENGHPVPSRLEVDIERASHKIVEMWMEGDKAFGKSEVLVHTPSGKILEGLLMSDVGLGVSTRGSGKMDESSGRISDFHMATVDAVWGPSAHSAYPETVMESIQLYKRGELIGDLAEAVIHDVQAQKYFQKELKRFIESIKTK